VTVKIKIKEHSHPFKAVERQIESFATDLQKRWAPIAEQIEGVAGSVTLETIDSVRQAAEASLQQQTWGMVGKHTEHIFAYGAQVAKLGEVALAKPPAVDAIVQAVKGGHYIDRQAMKFARAYAFNEIQTKDSSLFGELKTRLLQALERGEHPSKAARELARDIDGDYAGWMRIARTETARTLQAGLFDEAERLEVDVVYVPTSPTSCDECKRLIDGRVFMRSALEGKTNYKRKQVNWIPAVPLHPNCTHFAIPASDWLIEKAREVSGGNIPSGGVEVECLPPSER
jgi:hypothetical protein